MILILRANAETMCYFLFTTNPNGFYTFDMTFAFHQVCFTVVVMICLFSEVLSLAQEKSLRKRLPTKEMGPLEAFLVFCFGPLILHHMCRCTNTRLCLF